MAKKAKATKKKQSKKAAKKILTDGPIRRTLKQPTLTGMPRVRNARLDKYAEAVGECRDKINDATREVKGYKAAALKVMLEKKLSFWSHGGVDFIVTPGDPVLKVKTHKEGSSETGAGEDAEESEEVPAEDLYAEDAEGAAEGPDDTQPF
jgi:hypothetical protein